MATKVQLTAVIWPEGKVYVSKCPEIGVASYGKTPVAARKALQEAVELWMSNARKLAILDEFRPAFERNERYTTSLEVAV